MSRSFVPRVVACVVAALILIGLVTLTAAQRIFKPLVITPAKLNETILFDEHTYILDVRPPDDRKRYRGLPNSHEVSPFFAVEKYLGQLPRDKQILVVCPGGKFSLVVSYYLKLKGFKNVTNLQGGLDAWRKQQSDLYQKYAGQNITVLQPDKEKVK
jgi:rhodanese-related sulfurtransferase